MSTRLPIFRMALAAGLMSAPMVAFGQAPATPGAAPPPMAPASPSMTAPATPTAPALTTPGRMTDARRASKLIGANVYNERDESIGEIEDLLVSPSAGQTMVVVAVGGFLGIGEKLVAVPMSELTWNGSRERWTLAGATKASLEARPTFRYDGSRS